MLLFSKAPSAAAALAFAAFSPLSAVGGDRIAADTPWVSESISTHATGRWTPMVLYNRSTGLAHMNGGEHTYTPNAPSSGKYVTLNVRSMFNELDGGTPLADDSQAGIQIACSGTFQIWTKTGWLDVAAQGITPETNVEYSIQFILDYKAGVYSAAVQDDRGEWRRLRSARGAQSFPLGAKADTLKAITFEGKAKFRSLKGSYVPERPKMRSIRSTESNGRLGPPTVGETNRTVVWGRRQSAEQIERLFGAADSRRSKSNGFFANKNNKEMKHGN